MPIGVAQKFIGVAYVTPAIVKRQAKGLAE